jgi:hypothetical protein
MPRETVVVMLGHSYVRRLHEYVRCHPGLRDFELRNVRVHFIGLGGATLHPRRGSRCVFDFVEEAMRFSPDVLLLHVGENDLTTASITAQDLMHDYHSLANEFLSRHVSRVIISEPLSFPVQVRYHDTLSELRSLLRQRYSTVHSHNSNSIQLFTFSIPHRCFHADRVHLSCEGTNRYYRRMQFAVRRAVSSLSNPV